MQKTIAILVILAAAINVALGMTGRAMDKAKEVDAKCRQSVGGVAKGYFSKFIRGEIEDDDVETYKCFIKCVMMELAAISEDGMFDLEEELQNVPPEILEEGHRIVKACQNTKGDNPCDTAYKMHRCYHNENPELYSLVLHHWEVNAEKA